MVKIKKGLSDADMLKGFNENLTLSLIHISEPTRH